MNTLWKLVAFCSALLLPNTSLKAQLEVNIKSTLAVDYVMTPESPAYQQYGYGNQFQARYGLGAMVKISDRFSAGIYVDRYRRKEAFDCVYFPELDELPQPAWHPIIDSDVYECEYSYLSKIDFLEIPLVIRYDLFVGKTIRAYIGGGYGLQWVTKRSTLLTDQQTGLESREVTNTPFLRSKKSARMFSGITKKVSEHFSVDLGLEYRTDSFRFEYQSIGLTTRIAYSIN